MRQLNGCSTPAPRSRAAKQWFEQLAKEKGEKYAHQCESKTQSYEDVQKESTV